MITGSGVTVRVGDAGALVGVPSGVEAIIKVSVGSGVVVGAGVFVGVKVLVGAGGVGGPTIEKLSPPQPATEVTEGTHTTSIRHWSWSYCRCRLRR